jgi:hypothetical protein
MALGGEILEGMVKAGMSIELPSGPMLGDSRIIKSVELIDRSPQPGLVALMMDCAQSELPLWAQLAEQNCVVAIDAAADPKTQGRPPTGRPYA